MAEHREHEHNEHKHEHHHEHSGNERHICRLIKDKEDIEKIKLLVNKPLFICTSCGRVANDKKHLCAPINL